MPSVDNPANSFSGHCQRFSLNIQAVCDSNLRFIYFSLLIKGGVEVGFGIFKLVVEEV